MAQEHVATVLVTVKTYPSPSDKYGETVCVAGVRLDHGSPEWIRLYPMKFRMADWGQQFKKYEIIEIPVAPRGSKDPRPESMAPVQSNLKPIRVVDTSKNWAERRNLIRPLIGATTTCELIAANNVVDYSQPAPSLGLVEVRDVTVTVVPGEPWDPVQLAKVERAAQPDLFNQQGFKELEPAPYKVVVRYRCGSSACCGHEPSLLDWEAGQAGRRWRHLYGDAAVKTKLRAKYEELFGADRDAHLYVGNLHQHRTSFSALGVWSPKREEPDLFDSGALGYT